jgi:hypothetical protein
LPSLGGSWSFVRRYTSLLSFHTTAFKSPLVLTRMSPCFSLSVLGLRSLDMPFLCHITVPQQQKRPPRRWAWQLFFFRACRGVIFLLFTDRIHYDFSYMILRQLMILFHPRNLTFHWENCSTTSVWTAKSKLREIGILWWELLQNTCWKCFVLLPKKRKLAACKILWNKHSIPFTKCKTELSAQYFLKTYDTYAFMSI